MTITAQLFSLGEEDYARFQSRLTPTLPRECFIGVRVPALRKLAKALAAAPEGDAFLRALPHTYYEENMLHALLLNEMRDFDPCLAAVEAFLPYIDNWAVCDCLSPRVFARHKEALLPKIETWAASSHTYSCRFGIGMLMRHFLDEDFRPELLALPASVWSEEYYVNMMLAWFFATALAKQWPAAFPYLKEERLSAWVHNKTIQKSCESYRITDAQKALLRTMKRPLTGAERIAAR